MFNPIGYAIDQIDQVTGIKTDGIEYVIRRDDASYYIGLGEFPGSHWWGELHNAAIFCTKAEAESELNDIGEGEIRAVPAGEMAEYVINF